MKLAARQTRIDDIATLERAGHARHADLTRQSVDPHLDESGAEREAHREWRWRLLAGLWRRRKVCASLIDRADSFGTERRPEGRFPPASFRQIDRESCPRR
jgi:hypothetical protein